MRIRSGLTWGLLVLGLLVRPEAAGAISFGKPLPSAKNHDLSLGGGITTPSAIQASHQNPAGLVYTTRTTVGAYVQSSDESFGSPSGGGAVHFGDGNYGAVIGTDSEPVTGVFGLGIFSPEIGLSLGVVGFKDFSTGGATNFNMGVLAQLSEPFHIGFTTMDFMHSDREWGLGMRYDFAPTFSFATELAMSHDLAAKWVAPGVVIRTQGASLSVAYGFPTAADAPRVAQISEGVTLGGSVRPGMSTNIEFYYRKMGESYGYYAGLSVALN